MRFTTVFTVLATMIVFVAAVQDVDQSEDLAEYESVEDLDSYYAENDSAQGRRRGRSRSGRSRRGGRKSKKAEAAPPTAADASTAPETAAPAPAADAAADAAPDAAAAAAPAN